MGKDPISISFLNEQNRNQAFEHFVPDFEPEICSEIQELEQDD